MKTGPTCETLVFMWFWLKPVSFDDFYFYFISFAFVRSFNLRLHIMKCHLNLKHIEIKLFLFFTIRAPRLFSTSGFALHSRHVDLMNVDESQLIRHNLTRGISIDTDFFLDLQTVIVVAIVVVLGRFLELKEKKYFDRKESDISVRNWTKASKETHNCIAPLGCTMS